MCSLKAHRPGEAKAGLTACLGQRPGFGWLYVHKGLAEEELGEFQDAEDDLRRALTSDLGVAGQYTVQVVRGVGRVRRLKCAEAVADFQAAITLLLDQSEAYINLAQADIGLGRLEAALEELGKAIRLVADWRAAYRAGLGVGALPRREQGLPSGITTRP